MNDIPLRDYIDVKISDLNTRLNDQKISLDHRLDSMNAFREAMRDAQSNSVTKPELAELRNRVGDMRVSVASISSAIAIITSIITAIVISYVRP
jgi:hypothetical protein